MEREEMVALFPRKIKALLIDDETRFRTSSVKMLSLLNFKVSAYKSPTYALNRVLTGDKAKDVDVVFINTKKALSCGFDFRAIVQGQLFITVVYLLPRARRANGRNQVDQMRRALRPGTYTVSMPLDVEDVLRLWRFIAWSKHRLQNEKARRNEERKNQERIQFEMQQQQLRQSVMQSIYHALGMPMPPQNPNAAWPSNYLAAAGANTAGPSSLPVYPPPRPVYSAPVPAPPLPPPPVNPSLVPAQAQAPRPMYHPYQGPRSPVMPQGLFAQPRRGSGMPRRGNGGPIMLNFEQPQSSNRVTGVASSVGMGFGASAAGHVGAYNYAASSLHHSLNPAGTDDYNYNELFSAMVTTHTVSNNPPPMAPNPQQHVGVGSNVPTLLYNNNYYYNNSAGSVVAPEQAGHGVAASEAAAAMDALGSDNYTNYNNAAASLVAPQDDVPAYDLAAFEAELNSDDFSNYTDEGSHMAPPPDQVLGMASDLNDLITMAGGAFGGDVGASSASMAPPHQDLVVDVPNANQIPPGAPGNDDIDALLVEPQSPGAAVDGDNNAGLEAMFPVEQNEDSLFAQLQELMVDLDDAPTYEAGVGMDNSQMGGASTAADADADADAAATSLVGGESSMGIWDIDADNFEMVDDFDTGDFMLRMT
ncbi:unnamed protein product [Urochloa decumbens]|uniref:Response regulatory domain-containing protein n=1 Tax=Urochloa decumbens TaxID=240449 RepID=A0ABC9C1G8_9POAL